MTNQKYPHNKSIKNQDIERPVSNSIGSLEHHIHEIFASARVPLTGEDFVYCPNHDLYNALEEYCAVQTMHESKPPLLIAGETGSGKSALFANWMNRRQRQSSRTRNNDEFIFWCAVGSSRNSISVINLVKRLITDLKNRFELARELPTGEDRMTWELPRFLDLAAKKGKVIIIIDGVNRLIGKDDAEAGLAWLPLQFPPSVRLILSCTSYEEVHQEDSKDIQDNSTALSFDQSNRRPSTMFGSQSLSLSKDPSQDDDSQPIPKSPLALRYYRLIQEVHRRRWNILHMTGLDRTQRLNIVDAFIHKTVQQDIASLTTGPFLTALTIDGSNAAPSLADTPGFLLFESQINTLLAHPLSGSPLFLRILLCNANYAVKRGFSLWHIWGDWLEATTIQGLVDKILTNFEQGYISSADRIEDDERRIVKAGGLAALKRLYPWHPVFQVGAGGGNGADTLIAIDLRNQAENRDSDEASPKLLRGLEANLTGEAAPGEAGKGALSHSVLQNLGDQQWLAASDEADFKLDEARIQGERALEETLEGIARKATEHGISFLEAMIEHMNAAKASQAHLHSMASFSTVQDRRPVSHDSVSVSGMKKEESSSWALNNPSAMDSDEEGDAFHCRNLRHDSLSTASLASSMMDMHSQSQVLLTDLNEDDDEEENQLQQINESDEEKDPSAGPVASPKIQFKRQFSHRHHRVRGGNKSSTTTKKDHEERQGNSREGKRSLGRGAAMGPEGGLSDNRQSIRPSLNSHDNDDDDDELNVKNKQNSPQDPNFGLQLLPPYMRGGTSTRGFGSLLGNSLALLFVARHGLKEQELWAVLSHLRQETDRDHLYFHRNDDVTGAAKDLLLTLAQKRGNFENLVKSYDTVIRGVGTSRRGVVTKSQLISSIQSFVSSTKLEDIEILVDLVLKEFPECVSANNLSTPSTGQKSKLSIHYQSFLRGVNKKAHQIMKLNVSSSKRSQPNPSSPPSDRPTSNSLYHSLMDEYNHQLSVDSAVRRDQVILEAPADYSLGPILEDSLLMVLCSLGILHSTEHRIFLLPFDSTVLREVIKLRYIRAGLSSEDHLSNDQMSGTDSKQASPARPSTAGNSDDPKSGTKRSNPSTPPLVKTNPPPADEHVWHGHLILFFHQSTDSLRKCEELPWHLQICRRWFALRDALSELDTFELMYSGANSNTELKHELMRYWLLLTEGPLYVSDESEREAGAMRLPGAFGIMNHSTINLAPSGINGGSSSTRNNPTSQYDEDDELRRTLTILDTATVLGLTEKESKIQLLQNIVAPFDIVEEFNRSLESWVVSANPNPNRIQTMILQICSFLKEFSMFEKSPPLTFLRLGVKIDDLLTFGINVQQLVASNSDGTKTVAGSGASNGVAEEENYFPTPSMMRQQPRLYNYYRWLWIQYPWLGLCRAVAAGSEVIDAPTTSYPDMNVDPNQDIEAAAGAMAKFPNRFWDIKKQDPNREAYRQSTTRKLGLIRASVAPLHMDSLHNLDAIFQRIFNDTLHKPASELSVHITNSADLKPLRGKPSACLTKYRRPLSDEIELMKGIPYSGHSIRSLKAGTLFPSIEREIERKNALLEQSNPNLYREATNILKRGGHGLQLEPSLTDLVEQQNVKEQLETFNLQSTTHSSHVTNLSELHYEREREKLQSIKTVFDRLIALKKSKTHQLQSLREEFHHRLTQDRVAVMTMEDGENAILSLTKELADLSLALESSRKLRRGYGLLIDLEVKCPPYTDSHLEQLESEVRLAKQQVQALVHHRQNLYIQTAKDIAAKRRQLIDKCTYYRTARALLDRKVSQFLTDSQSRHLPIPSLADVTQTAPADSLAFASVAAAYKSHNIDIVDDLMSRHSHDSVQSGPPIVLNDVMRKFGAAISKKVIQFGALNSPVEGLHEPLAPSSAAVPGSSDATQSVMLDMENAIFSAPVSPVPSAKHGRPKWNSDEFNYQRRGSLKGAKLFARSPSADAAKKPPKVSSPLGRAQSPTFLSKSLSRRLSNVAAASPRANSTEPRRKSIDLTEEQKTKQGKARAARHQIHLIRDKTGCGNIDEFIERFKSNQKLVESLRSHQILADSKLAQLRGEYNELYGSLGDNLVTSNSPVNKGGLPQGQRKDSHVSSQGSADGTAPINRRNSIGFSHIRSNLHDADPDPNPNRTSTQVKAFHIVDQAPLPDEEKDGRYLDHKLIEAEMRMHQQQKRMERAIRLQNEVKMGVWHLVSFIDANKHVLSALPKAAPAPVLDSNQVSKGLKSHHLHPSTANEEETNENRVVQALNWCEERLLAINEVMMLENTKQAGINDSTDPNSVLDLPLHQRQSLLATAMFEANQSNKKPSKGASSQRHGQTTKKPRKRSFLASKQNELETSHENNDRAVILVKSIEQKDVLYDEKTKQLNDKRDSREEWKEEQFQLTDGLNQSAADVRRFVDEALTSHATQELLRKTNTLAKKKLGKYSTGYGWALESVLNHQDENAGSGIGSGSGKGNPTSQKMSNKNSPIDRIGAKPKHERINASPRRRQSTDMSIDGQ